ncbi:MAG: DUF3343 domain-containing protein [Eubacteriales bacterium]|nr:DUF3343 domain-containing protein [Eubacteriales bacterium]
MMEEYGIAAFRSRSQVLQLEAAAKQAGIEGRIVSTPRAAAAGCGLSFMVAQKDLARLQQLIRQRKYPTLIGLYRVDTSSGRTRLQVYSSG